MDQSNFVSMYDKGGCRLQIYVYQYIFFGIDCLISRYNFPLFKKCLETRIMQEKRKKIVVVPNNFFLSPFFQIWRHNLCIFVFIGHCEQLNGGCLKQRDQTRVWLFGPFSHHFCLGTCSSVGHCIISSKSQPQIKQTQTDQKWSNNDEPR